MPVNSVPFVELNRLRKVLNRFLVLKEPIPNEPSSIVTRRIMVLLNQHLIEVFQSHGEAVAAYFFANRAQVVHCLDVRRL